MAKIITSDELESILKSAPGRYFFHKEEDGEVIVTFTSPITITHPGDEDLLGRLWDPKITDNEGNPLLDFSGKPRQKWSKVEAECLINGVKHIYAFGGTKSNILKSLLEKMNAEGISNQDLPGTKWSITRLGQWDWAITYLGREEKHEDKGEDDTISKIKNAIDDLKKDNPKADEGITKNEFLQTISFLAGVKPTDIIERLEELTEKGIITLKGNDIYLN